MVLVAECVSWCVGWQMLYKVPVGYIDVVDSVHASNCCGILHCEFAVHRLQLMAHCKLGSMLHACIGRLYPYVLAFMARIGLSQNTATSELACLQVYMPV